MSESVTAHWAQQFCLGCENPNYGVGPYCSQGCRIRDYQSSQPASLQPFPHSPSCQPPVLEVDNDSEATSSSPSLGFVSLDKHLRRPKATGQCHTTTQALIPAAAQIAAARRGGLVLPPAYDFRQHRSTARQALHQHLPQHQADPDAAKAAQAWVRKTTRMRTRVSPPARQTQRGFFAPQLGDLSVSVSSSPTHRSCLRSAQEDGVVSCLEERTIYLTLEHALYGGDRSSSTSPW